MKIFVKVKTGAKNDKIEKIKENIFLISAKARPIKGRANAAVLKELSEYFGVSPSRIKIISGRTSRQKILEIK